MEEQKPTLCALCIRRAAENDIAGLQHLLEQVNRVHHEGRPDLFKLTTKYSDEDHRASGRTPARRHQNPLH